MGLLVEMRDYVLGTAMKDRVGIVVAGMHRSGTSAMTRVINLLGADITSNLMPPIKDQNDLGFWESVKIANIHDNLLRELNSSWDDPIPLPPHWINSVAAQEAKRQISVEIERDFAASAVFVAKDPRLTRLLPLWLELFKEKDIEPFIVIPFRNPLEVADSLKKRNGFAPEQSALLYVYSNLEVELASRGQRRLFIPYDRLLSDCASVIVDLTQTCHQLDAIPSDAVFNIEHFLRNELYHHRHTRDSICGEPSFARTIVELYDSLVSISKNGGEDALRQSFDTFRNTIAEGAKLFHMFIATPREEMQQYAQKATLLNAELAVRNAELTELRNNAVALRTDLTAARGQTAQLEAELALQRAESAELQTALTTTQNEAAALEKRITILGSEAVPLNDRVTELTAANNAIRQSTSWHITRPLRWFGTKFPYLSRWLGRSLRGL